MFSNSIISIVLISIYVLAVINIGIVSAIFLSILKDKHSASRYSKRYNSIKPFVLEYLINDKVTRKLMKIMNNKFSYRIALDIMLEYTEENKVKIPEKFEAMGFPEFCINKAGRGIDLHTIKTFGLMGSPKAYDTLLKWTKSEDFDEKYASFYSLSLLELEMTRIERVIGKLLRSSVTRDRKIEIINNFNLSIEDCLDFLERQSSEIGKIVFLRVIQGMGEVREEAYSDRLLKYLRDEKEVRISAVLAVSASQNPMYLPELLGLYDREEAWEVRSAIAKSLINFPKEGIITPLRMMIYDKEWWVRFNAVELLAKLGSEGLDVLIDLSLDRDNEQVSNLAYQVLNSNKNVYETVRSS